ncbi:MAG TPA: nitrite reductase small subunit NirD [Planctomycetota bacterium]|nr:nitrite reductase small subunit NirD [Planctomycetota bacterium]
MAKPNESRGLDYLRKTRPEALSHLLAFFRESARHLDPKTRFLISVVTKVISGSPRGVRQYVRRALEEGASPNEILDAILCAYPCAGLTRVVDAIDTILAMGLPGFAPEEIERLSSGIGGAAGGDAESGGDVGEARDRELSAEPPTPLDDPLQQVVLEGETSGWHEVGTLDELEGERRLRVLAGKHDVAIFRWEGEIYAVGNRCPHAGGPLSEGMIVGGHVVCPLHAWRFNLRTGQCPDIARASIPTYETRVDGNRVLVRFPN